MTTLSLTAWSTVERVELTSAQAHALSATRAVTVTPGWVSGTYTVAAGPHVGVLSTEGVEVQLRPRITIARLMFLMGYAQDPRSWRDDPVGLQDQADLWPAMAQVLVRQTDRALERGVLQGYRTEEASQLLMRGRLRESEQLRRRPGLAIPLEVRYDEYDIDILENQILRAAAERLLRVPRLPATAVRRLRHVVGRLADVQRLVPGQPLPATPSSRLNVRYQPALALARMVLRSRSVDVLDSGVRATGFLVNMNTVFEEFVAVSLSEALASFGGRCVAQDKRHHLDVSGRIRLIPDLVRYGTDSHPQTVVDAKYKSGSSASYPNADVYQLLAYCMALRVRVGHLIYAEGDAIVRDVQVRNADVIIRQHALNLSSPVPELMAHIAELARSVAAEGNQGPEQRIG
jgi:5-methylcytosine-specific restriction enzyme subunit McrC